LRGTARGHREGITRDSSGAVSGQTVLWNTREGISHPEDSFAITRRITRGSSGSGSSRSFPRQGSLLQGLLASSSAENSDRQSHSGRQMLDAASSTASSVSAVASAGVDRTYCQVSFLPGRPGREREEGALAARTPHVSRLSPSLSGRLCIRVLTQYAVTVQCAAVAVPLCPLCPCAPVTSVTPVLLPRRALVPCMCLLPGAFLPSTGCSTPCAGPPVPSVGATSPPPHPHFLHSSQHHFLPPPPPLVSHLLSRHQPLGKGPPYPNPLVGCPLSPPPPLGYPLQCLPRPGAPQLGPAAPAARRPQLACKADMPAGSAQLCRSTSGQQVTGQPRSAGTAGPPHRELVHHRAQGCQQGTPQGNTGGATGESDRHGGDDPLRVSLQDVAPARGIVTPNAQAAPASLCPLARQGHRGRAPLAPGSAPPRPADAPEPEGTPTG